MSAQAPIEGSSAQFRLTSAQWLALVLATLALVFILMNRDTTSINFFGATVQAPLWLVLVVIFAVGWLTGVMTTRRKQKRTAAQAPSGGKKKK